MVYLGGHLGMVSSCIWVNTVNYVEITKQLLGRYASDLKETKLGVPQGSVRCLHLYGLYINDLPNLYPRAKTILFADDTHIHIKAANEDVLNQKISSYVVVTVWFHVNGLVINT
jgi:hypothetical protein